MNSSKCPEKNPNSIGNILRRNGLSDEQLAAALEFQQNQGGGRLGNICVLMGFVDPDTLSIAVATQAAQRKGGVRDLARIAVGKSRLATTSVDALISTGNRLVSILSK
ncbi:MAG: hypothetical protein MJA83_05725 [Gammaproteobacteria bacterium]|nr:hypothetical protein [Gammaproteobacteria bacterium]